MSEIMMDIILAFVAGAFLMWIWMRQKTMMLSQQLEQREKYGSQEQIRLQDAIQKSEQKVAYLEKDIRQSNIELASSKKHLVLLENQKNIVEHKCLDLDTQCAQLQQSHAVSQAENAYLREKLQNQKGEMALLNEKFNTEFRLIAADILKSNTTEFSKLNETKMKELLNPLGENIKEFKNKVESVYDLESKERFSLSAIVKELAAKSDQIGKDAVNLTKALKGQVKTQGRWGEMILESILEKSGLRKNEEYFMEAQLFDAEGNALRSELAGKKMRPDALIKYPDNRNVIIDSKVSLNAFTRYFESEDADLQNEALMEHVSSIKEHIKGLSAKGYDDYDKSMDFVMLFIPSEPAYIAALQAEPGLWNYAYDKRILLINPTNLIAALKLLVDLWKREYQNRNAKDIAERGEKLYKKFVSFIENMDAIGEYLSKAQNKYDDAYKQMSTGADNLVRQANKLKELGNMQMKKDLNQELVERSMQDHI